MSWRGCNRCSHCGKFFSYADFDEFTNFGSSNDVDPPEPELLCAKCSKKLEDEMVGRRSVWTPWRPGRCHENAARRLGWRYSRPRHAAWGQYRDPSKPLPDGWEWLDVK
jgi:DNA-directed RNA polymerase subunit RPC12/RpoP